MKSIYTYWSFNFPAFVGMLMVCLAYLKYHEFVISKWLIPFVTSLILFTICFFSPLSLLSQQYLFSAHMVVHVALLLVVGPLLVLSLQKNETQNKFVSNLSTAFFKRPALGWIAGVGIMWLWHIPFVFNYSMHVSHASTTLGFVLHGLENITLLIAGMLFAWPILSPVKDLSLAPLSGVAYLFTACIGCSLLGLLITFAPAGMYQHFLSPMDTNHLNNLILNEWQLTQLIDQQAAGLIMWVPCCLLYVVYALYLLAQWFSEKDIVGLSER